MNTETNLPEVELYSDGWANPNPWKWWYWVILHYKWVKKEFLQWFKLTTNNRMELTGVITGLENLKTKSIVNIYTDSQYTINWIEKWWAEKWKKNDWYRTKSEKAINYDLWEKLLDLVSKHKVKFNWVKWHNGHIENERCDKLATLAMNMDNLIVDINYISHSKNILQIKNNNVISLNFLKDNKVSWNSKIVSQWDNCRKCNIPVEKKIPKHTKKTLKKSYYYEYYFSCSWCKTVYMPEEAKRKINSLKL